MKELFAQRLISARRMAGFSLQELSDRVSFTKQAISKYEKGLMKPTSTAVIELAKALGVKPDYFFKNTAEGLLLEHIKFREEAKHDSQELEQVKSKTLNYLERYLELEKVSAEELEIKNPIHGFVVRTRHDAEKAAITLRKKWRLGEGPLINVAEVLERQGVKVVEVNQSLDFEGFSTWAGKVPVIVVNQTVKEVTRRRFTTLHELGHLLLTLDEEALGYQEVERLCDAFAGAMLIPEHILKKELHNRTSITTSELTSLKGYYGVSVQAILVRAALLKLIDWGAYEQWKNIGQPVDAGHFAGEERPRRFHSLLWKCLNEEKITLSKAAELANSTVESLKVIREREVMIAI